MIKYILVVFILCGVVKPFSIIGKEVSSSEIEVIEAVDICLAKLQELGISGESLGADRVAVTIANYGAGVTFSNGTKGRVDYYDPNYYSIMTCLQNKAYHVIYLRPMNGDIIFGNLDGDSHPDTSDIYGATGYFLSFIDGELLMKTKYNIPVSFDEVESFTIEQRNFYNDKYNEATNNN